MSTGASHRGHDLTSRARIRNAALRLFARDGVDGTSLRAIAAEAGVTVGLIPHHFGSKDGLLAQVEEWVIEQFEKSIETANSIAGPKGARSSERDREVARMLNSEPVIVDFLRRELFYPSAGSRLLQGLVSLAQSGVDEMRALGLVTTGRNVSDQVVDALIRYVGKLFMQPLVDRAFAEVEAGAPVSCGRQEPPQVSVSLRRRD